MNEVNNGKELPVFLFLIDSLMKEFYGIRWQIARVRQEMKKMIN